MNWHNAFIVMQAFGKIALEFAAGALVLIIILAAIFIFTDWWKE